MRSTVGSRPEGGVPTGRMGAGEQRSAERGSPAYPPGRASSCGGRRAAAPPRGIAAALSERAAQRTLAASEGGDG